MAAKQQFLNDQLTNAAKNGYFIDAKRLVRKGAQVDKPIEGLGGMTPIMVALDLADPWTKGHHDIVNLLLKSGANPNQTYQIDEKLLQVHPDFERLRDMSLLTRAACQGHLGILQLLVK